MILDGLEDVGRIRCVITAVDGDELVSLKVVATIRESEGFPYSSPIIIVDDALLLYVCHNNVGLFSSLSWGSSIEVIAKEFVCLNIKTLVTISSIE